MADETIKSENENASNGYEAIYQRFNALLNEYSGLTSSSMWGALQNSAQRVMANMPQIQNSRIKGIPALPVEYTKEQIGDFLREPYAHETELQQTAEILRWTNYPFYKIIKTYQDISTARHYTHPVIGTSDWNDAVFLREAKLLDKFSKKIKPSESVHEIIGEALIAGKVFYYLCKEIDRVHNNVNYAFLQRLPQKWCKIIGGNNLSKRTVSFDMMYFLQPGTTPSQYGRLFEPYLDDFNDMFDGEPVVKAPPRTRYTSKIEKVDCKGRKIRFDPTRVKPNAEGNPRVVFEQNSRWAYYVSLPVEDVWVFEIDDTTPAVISPLAGLMLTYSQQSDFEQAQLSNIISPLLMFFTGEIPYFENEGTHKVDDYRLSNAGRVLYEVLFDNMLAANNTSGVGLFQAPLKNIKSHTFPEAANANDIAQKYSEYSTGKSGLAALIPTETDIKASQVDSAQKLESRYTCAIYRQFENMMNYVYDSLNLRYDWRFVMFGSVYTEDAERDKARKAFELGDTSAMYILAALDGESIIDKLSMIKGVAATGIMDEFRIPETAYTQSKPSANSPAAGESKQTISVKTADPGRPQSEGITSEGKEKAIDAGYTEA